MNRIMEVIEEKGIKHGLLRKSAKALAKLMLTFATAASLEVLF